MIVHMIGVAQLRPLGAWNLAAGMDEAMATIRSAVERCEEYPEFQFSLANTWPLQVVEKHDPSLMKRIKKLVKKKQWYFVGPWVNEIHPDNSSNRLWNKNLTLGHQYASKQFGVSSNTAVHFESDSFSTVFRDQLIDQGIRNFVYKGKLPANLGTRSCLYRWMQDNGEYLLAYCAYPHYRTRSFDLYGQIMEAVESGNLQLGHALCFYGVGNHGGGPTKQNIEYILENQNAYEGVELRFSNPDAFFGEAQLMADAFPEHDSAIEGSGIGHFSIGRAIRKQQQDAEMALEVTEHLYDRYKKHLIHKTGERQFSEHWNRLLLGASTSAMGGKITYQAMQTVSEIQKRVISETEDWMYKLSRDWARSELEPTNHQQIVLLNPYDYDWEGWVEWKPNLDGDNWGKRQLLDETDSPVDYQLVETYHSDGAQVTLLFKLKIPAGSYRLWILREFGTLNDQLGEVKKPDESALKVNKTQISNDLYRLRVSPRSITRICSAQSEDQDDGNWLGRLGITFSLKDDNTGLESKDRVDFDLPLAGGIESEGWTIEEQGTHRMGLSNGGILGGSRYQWRLQMYAGDPRIFIELGIWFQEQERLLQMNFQFADKFTSWVDSHSSHYVNEMTSAAECAFRGWIMGRNQDRQFGVFSEDVFSASFTENELSLTLLRSAAIPEPYNASMFQFTDQGYHLFRIQLLPDCKVRPEDLPQYWLNPSAQPIVWDRYEGMNRPAWENATPPHLQEANEKRALADGLMQHLKPDA